MLIKAINTITFKISLCVSINKCIDTSTDATTIPIARRIAAAINTCFFVRRDDLLVASVRICAIHSTKLLHLYYSLSSDKTWHFMPKFPCIFADSLLLKCNSPIISNISSRTYNLVRRDLRKRWCTLIQNYTCYKMTDLHQTSSLVHCQNGENDDIVW